MLHGYFHLKFYNQQFMKPVIWKDKEIQAIIQCTSELVKKDVSIRIKKLKQKAKSLLWFLFLLYLLTWESIYFYHSKISNTFLILILNFRIRITSVGLIEIQSFQAQSKLPRPSRPKPWPRLPAMYWEGTCWTTLLDNRNNFPICYFFLLITIWYYHFSISQMIESRKILVRKI